MPIPPFDHNGVIPPFVGNVANFPAARSPYRATILELCHRWGSSGDRRRILVGLIGLRDALRQINLAHGFQWLDGSFLEDAEATRGRPPNDIDVVTFYWAYTAPTPSPSILATLADRDLTKEAFCADHLAVCLNWHPI